MLINIGKDCLFSHTSERFYSSLLPDLPIAGPAAVRRIAKKSVACQQIIGLDSEECRFKCSPNSSEEAEAAGKMEYFCDVRHILSALNHLFFTRLTISAESRHFPLAKHLEHVLKFPRLQVERFVANQSFRW
jgi:hypothetical protein